MASRQECFYSGIEWDFRSRRAGYGASGSSMMVPCGFISANVSASSATSTGRASRSSPGTANGNPDRLLAVVQELARQPVDVIAVAGSSAAKAAQAATNTVPIVAMVIGDPVAIGLVTDWQRPGGNITGSTTLGSDLALKRLQLLKSILPYLSRVAYFWNPANPSSRAYLEHLRIAASPIGATIVTIEAGAVSEFDKALEQLAKSQAHAMLTAGDIVQQQNIYRIIDFQLKHHLTGMFTRREDVGAGGLMSYGVSVPELYRNGAVYVHQILNGARPAELSFVQPAKLELVINLEAAKTTASRSRRRSWLPLMRSYLMRRNEASRLIHVSFFTSDHPRRL